MKCYRLKTGKYAFRLPNGKLQVFLPGEMVKTDQDLVNAFPNKFEEVLDVNPVMSAVSVAYKAREDSTKVEDEEGLPPEPQEEDTNESPTVEGDEESDEEHEEEVEEGIKAKDVTKKFPLFRGTGLKAYFEDGEFVVVVNKDTKAGPFKGRNDVLDWFKKWKKSNK